MPKPINSNMLAKSTDILHGIGKLCIAGSLLLFLTSREKQACLKCLITIFHKFRVMVRYLIHVLPSQGVGWDLLLTSPLTGQQVTRMMPWSAGLLSCCTVGNICCEASWAGRLQKVLETSDGFCVKTSLSPYISLSDGNIHRRNRGWEGENEASLSQSASMKTQDCYWGLEEKHLQIFKLKKLLQTSHWLSTYIWASSIELGGILPFFRLLKGKQDS